jgi:hypothetical protein
MKLNTFLKQAPQNSQKAQKRKVLVWTACKQGIYYHPFFLLRLFVCEDLRVLRELLLVKIRLAAHPTSLVTGFIHLS